MERRPIRRQRRYRLPTRDDGGPARGRDLDHHDYELDDKFDDDEHHFFVNDVVDHNVHPYDLHHPRNDCPRHHHPRYHQPRHHHPRYQHDLFDDAGYDPRYDSSHHNPESPHHHRGSHHRHHGPHH
ncbi:MAG: hypothetical protein ACRDVD_05530, partial [Acidimicrobiia bacterium]